MTDYDSIRLRQLFAWWTLAEYLPPLLRRLVRRLVVEQARWWWGQS